MTRRKSLLPRLPVWLRSGVAAVALLGGLGACAGGVRGAAGQTLNALAAASQGGAGALLSAECAAQARAVGHAAQWDGSHCSRLDDAGAASEAQRAELARVRAQWAKVNAAYRVFSDAHDAARQLLDFAGATDAQAVDAIARLAAAYAALSDAATTVGLTMAPLSRGAGAGAQ